MGEALIKENMFHINSSKTTSIYTLPVTWELSDSMVIFVVVPYTKIMLWYLIQLPFGGFQLGLHSRVCDTILVVNAFQQIFISARASPQMVGSEEMKEFRIFLFPSLTNSDLDLAKEIEEA